MNILSCIFLFQFLFGKVAVRCCVRFLEVGLYLVEGFFAALLVMVAGLGYGVALVVGLLAELFAQLLVVYLVAVLALHVGAELLRELFLKLAHRADGFLCHLEGLQEVLL